MSARPSCARFPRCTPSLRLFSSFANGVQRGWKHGTSANPTRTFPARKSLKSTLSISKSQTREGRSRSRSLTKQRHNPAATKLLLLAPRTIPARPFRCTMTSHPNHFPLQHFLHTQSRARTLTIRCRRMQPGPISVREGA